MEHNIAKLLTTLKFRTLLTVLRFYMHNAKSCNMSPLISVVFRVYNLVFFFCFFFCFFLLKNGLIFKSPLVALVTYKSRL